VLRYRRVESFSDTNLSWHGVWSEQYGNLYRRTLIYHPGFWNFVLRTEEQKGMRMEALKFYLKDRRRSNLVGEYVKGAPDELAGWNAFSDAAAEHNAFTDFTELGFSGTEGVLPIEKPTEIGGSPPSFSRDTARGISDFERALQTGEVQPAAVHGVETSTSETPS
jgi:hypothetical protein